MLTIPATRNRTRDHLIAAAIYSQMLYQLSYSRLVYLGISFAKFTSTKLERVDPLNWATECRGADESNACAQQRLRQLTALELCNRMVLTRPRCCGQLTCKARGHRAFAMAKARVQIQ